MELMQQVVHEKQQTLVMVTHDNHLASFADRIFHTIDGKIVRIDDMTGKRRKKNGKRKKRNGRKRRAYEKLVQKITDSRTDFHDGGSSCQNSDAGLCG